MFHWKILDGTLTYEIKVVKTNLVNKRNVYLQFFCLKHCNSVLIHSNVTIIYLFLLTL